MKSRSKRISSSFFYHPFFKVQRAMELRAFRVHNTPLCCCPSIVLPRAVQVQFCLGVKHGLISRREGNKTVAAAFLTQRHSGCKPIVQGPGHKPPCVAGNRARRWGELSIGQLWGSSNLTFPEPKSFSLFTSPACEPSELRANLC